MNKRGTIVREPPCYEFESPAPQSSAIMGMVIEISDKDIRYITDAGLFICVILAGAQLPATAISDVAGRCIPDQQRVRNSGVKRMSSLAEEFQAS